MGRHRRSGAAPAEADYATGTDRGHGGTRRKRRRPVRTGLIGASAAVVVGAAAVAVAAPGILPGGEKLTAGDAGGSRPAAAETRRTPELTTQGGATRTPAGASTATGGTGGTSGTGEATRSARKSAAPASPEATPTPTKTAAPSPAPSRTRTAKAPAPATTPAKPKPSKTAKAPAATQAAPAPTRTTRAPVEETAAPAGSTADRADAAEAEVLRLVNAERAKVGCSAVQPSAGLARLAGAFSADMAARNFFDHTDPDGATPWSRAQAAGITSLGAENIARGQVDATAVMVSWMNSDGHRANILNCDFTSLGVGVHFADGGPWWTQDFGY
ncbi:CAP domain-containing protein [Streptomyces sp. NPDC007945]|uniref:CAP domain-containing protein n=1 Tax=Streptomyces sp. NPDC007945 TaxID=3364797 RepID=UPI0036E4197C